MIILTEKQECDNIQFNSDEYINHTFVNKKELQKTLAGFETSEKIKLIVCAENSKKIFEKLCDTYKTEKAAGGVVFKGNRVLCIFRYSKWDLPKGKIEHKEKNRIAAVREVEEECGISNVTVEKKIGMSYHIYKKNGKNVLKQTLWYLMNYQGDEQPIPQKSEGITDVRWFSKNEMKIVMENTYSSLIDIFNHDSVLIKLNS